MLRRKFAATDATSNTAKHSPLEGEGCFVSKELIVFQRAFCENFGRSVSQWLNADVNSREQCQSDAEITCEKYLQRRGDRFVLESELVYGGSERDHKWRALNEEFEQGEITIDPLTMVFEERRRAFRHSRVGYFGWQRVTE